jgi:hypothetical protein
MRSMRTIRWGVGALVICAGLAALRSGIAQETTERDDARDEASDALADEERERETRRADVERERRERREQEAMEQGERGRGRDAGERGRGGDGGEGGRGGFGGGGGGGRGGYGGEGGEGGGGGYGGGRGGYGFGRGGEYGGAGGGMEGYGGATTERKPKEVRERGMIKPDSLPGLTKKIITMHAQPEKMNRIREAAAALVEAGDYGRAGSERQLNELLDEYFEEDMKHREEELANVERRVKELRELLERRREKKDDILRLQVEVLRNEADGLGFFSAEGSGGGKGSGPGAFPQLPPLHPPVQAVPATPYAPGAPAAPVVAPAPVPVKR